MAQSFARLGTEVILIECAARVVPLMDADVSESVRAMLEQDGVICLTDHFAQQVDQREGMIQLSCAHDGKTVVLTADQLLIAVGRRPVTDGLGLKQLGLVSDGEAGIEVDRYLRTRIPNIFACGDVTGGVQLTHAAGNQGWYAAVNALLGGVKSFSVKQEVMPQVMYTQPEAAAVGMTEQQAIEQGVEYQVTRYDLADLDRAITDEVGQGFVKILTRGDSDRILGAAIVAPRAGEMIFEYVIAMQRKLGLNALLSVIRPYPSYGEAGRYAAAAWKRAHAPEKLLSLLQRWHSWRRE
jgi:pyruvate/2-oxoglutarate dehydrogenase complex dihydrolipoamide dehydrogenase (E3) component